MTAEELRTQRLNTITKATFLLAFFTLVSRLLGYVRDLILASTFGASLELDTYNAAFRVPDFVFNFFILGTLTVAFLPVFNRDLVQDKQRAEKFASTVYTISVVFMAAFSLLIILFAPLIIGMMFPQFEGEQRQMTILMTRIMMLSPILFTASNMAAVLLQSFNKFLPTAVSPILYNLGIIAGATLFYKSFGLVGLAYGVALGAIVHTLIHIVPLAKLPIKIKPTINFKLSELRELWRLYLPRLFAFDTYYVSLFIATIIGQYLAVGSISIFTFASNLQAAPIGIFALSFAVAAFPALSQTWASQQGEDFRAIIRQTSVQILFFIIPISAFIFILRAQLVRILLGRGEFGWQETILTAQTLGILSLSLFAQSLTPLFARAFYATHNTIVPVIVSVGTAIANIILAITFSKSMGVAGLALATSISAVLSFLLLFIALKIKIGHLSNLSVIERVLKIFVATVFSGVATYAMLYAADPVLNTRTTIGLLIQTILALSIGLVIYITLGLLLNLPEAKSFSRRVGKSLQKLFRPLSALVSIGE